MSADPDVTIEDFIEEWGMPFGFDTCAPEAWGPMPPHHHAEGLPWPRYIEDMWDVPITAQMIHMTKIVYEGRRTPGEAVFAIRFTDWLHACRVKAAPRQ